jgi:hypothetical protein
MRTNSFLVAIDHGYHTLVTEKPAKAGSLSL